jgi:hypothetical protein
MAAVLDHLMWGAPSLEAGIAAATQLFGVEAAPGGAHAGRGTCNALLSLGDGVYLEIIAPDPQQPGARGFAAQLAALAQPALITWAAGSRNLQAVAAAAEHAALQPRGPVTTTRTTPQGELLEWQLLFLQGHAYGGLMPFFIDWLQCTHPAAVNPRAGELLQLTLHTPEAAALSEVFAALELPVAVEKSATPAIQALVATPREPVTLTSTAQSLALQF